MPVTVNGQKHQAHVYERVSFRPGEAIEGPAIVVQVDSTNRVYVNRTLTDVERVGAQIERFRSDNPNSPVLIESAEDAEHGVIVDVWDQAREVGAVGISITVIPPTSS